MNPQTKVSIAVVLPHSMFKQREYKKMIMQSASGLSGMDFVADYELSPFLEMVHPIPAPTEVLGKICDQFLGKSNFYVGSTLACPDCFEL